MRLLLSLATVVPLVPTIFGLTINTPPPVVQCQPALLSWSDGTGPFFLTILPGGQISAPPLKTFDQTDATSLTWTVDIAAGQSVTLQIRDSTGSVAFSDQVTIQSSSNSDCVNSSTAASGSTGAAGATTSGSSTASGTTGSTTSGATTTGTRATTGSSTGSSAGSSTTSSSPASNTSNAAVRGAVSYGAVGIAGLWGLAAAL